MIDIEKLAPNPKAVVSNSLSPVCVNKTNVINGSVSNKDTTGSIATGVIEVPTSCPSNFLGMQSTSSAPTLLSAVLVIVGWFVVNKTQANRERRKQIREYVVGLKKELDELEKVAINYHTSERDIPKEREVVSKLGRFEKACNTLPRFIASQKFCRALEPHYLEVDARSLQELRKAMTLFHFADEHTGPLNAQVEFIQNLELAAESVQEKLENVRIAGLD